METELPANINFLPGSIEINPLGKFNNLDTKDIFQILLLIRRESKVELNLILKLLKPVRIENNLGCWFRSKDWSHYTIINGCSGHRLSYDIFRGDLIPTLEICHYCDRKGCINPYHLYQATHSKNMLDARIRGI